QSGRAAPCVPRFLHRAIARASVSLLPDHIRRKLELGSRYDLTRFDRTALRLAGRLADRHVDRAAPHCQASVRLGLPHDFLFKSPAEQQRLLAA
ncbi:MAG: histidine kinase, partial [Sphingomonadales bacterium]